MAKKECKKSENLTKKYEKYPELVMKMTVKQAQELSERHIEDQNWDIFRQEFDKNQIQSK
jgi:hypothetical protein